MKTIIIVALLLCISVSAFAQNTLIPDPAFEQALIDLNLDTGPINGSVPTANINIITSLNVNSKGVSDLTGIEDFTLLEELLCKDNLLTAINVTQNLQLNYLDCQKNEIAAIDVTQNLQLVNLHCEKNEITSIDVTQNLELKFFYCNNNQFTNLDVTQNLQLVIFYCSSNQLTSLDVTQNLELWGFRCSSNQLSNINVTQNANLFDLVCGYNLMTTVNVTQNPLLNWLYLDGLNLTSLDISQNPSLTNLSCTYNQLTTIDVTQKTQLRNLHLNNNQLTSLDVTNNPFLIDLYVSYNNLTVLDVTQNVVLQRLNCYNNAITALDIFQNPSLQKLYCDNNQIENLIVGNNPLLDAFACSNNNIKFLDLSGVTALKYLYAQNNALESLFVKNGNNTNISYFKANGNPDLFCTEVDDPVYSATNWTNVSAQITFSEDCSLKLAPKVFLQGAASNPVAGEELLMRDDLRLASYMPLISPFTDTETCDASVLTVIGNNAIVDWVWVELRDAMDDSIIISGQSALLQRDGDVVGVDGISPLGFRNLPNAYHVMIKHQSHLGIVSSTTLQLDHNVSSLDMLTAASTVKGGSNAVSIMPNGLYAMYCGDFDNNGQVQNTDISSVRLLIGGSGYSKADMDMNGQIQNTDINNIMNPNVGKGEQF